MIQKIRALLLSLSTLMLFAFPLAIGGVASADVTQGQISNNTCGGTNVNLVPSGTCAGVTSGSTSTLNNTIATAINVISAIVGIIAVIIIIVAGLRYVSSGGSEEGVKGAKNSIMYAIIGLVIVALAQVIVHFVLNRATGTASS